MFRALALIFLSFHSPRPDLEHLKAVWLNRLSLSDWNVSITLVSSHELGDDFLGDIVWDPHTKSARIRILREQDYDLPRRLARRDEEGTLVHELVHLRRGTSSNPRLSNDENSVCAETAALLRKNRCWLDLAAME